MKLQQREHLTTVRPKMTKCFSAVLLHCQRIPRMDRRARIWNFSSFFMCRHKLLYARHKPRSPGPCSLHKSRVHAPQGTTPLGGTCHQDGRGPLAKTPAVRRAPVRQKTPGPPEETVQGHRQSQPCELKPKELEEAASERPQWLSKLTKLLKSLRTLDAKRSLLPEINTIEQLQQPSQPRTSSVHTVRDSAPPDWVCRATSECTVEIQNC